MGYMTEFYMLNDDWHNIKKSILDDPQSFVDHITVGMNGTYHKNGRLDVSRFKNHYFHTMASHHADDRHIYVSSGNLMSRVDAGMAYYLTATADTDLNSPVAEYPRTVETRDVEFMLERVQEAKRELDGAEHVLTRWLLKNAERTQPV
jgi:hypothetical protein